MDRIGEGLCQNNSLAQMSKDVDAIIGARQPYQLTHMDKLTECMVEKSWKTQTKPATFFRSEVSTKNMFNQKALFYWTG